MDTLVVYSSVLALITCMCSIALALFTVWFLLDTLSFYRKRALERRDFEQLLKSASRPPKHPV